GLGSWTFDGNPLEVGMEVFMHEFPLLKATTSLGAGLPYMSMSYECGNHLGYNDASQYTLEVDVPSLAEIAAGDTYGDTVITETVVISKGLSNKIAKVSIDISGDMFSTGPSSEVVV